MKLLLIIHIEIHISFDKHESSPLGCDLPYLDQKRGWISNFLSFVFFFLVFGSRQVL